MKDSPRAPRASPRPGEARAGRGRLPLVTVVVPCRDEEAFIRPCLRSVLENGYPSDRLQVLAVDGRSEDGTREAIRELAGEHPALELVDNPDRWTPHALNRGVRRAEGEVVARVDAHSTLEPGYLETCVECLREREADAVGGVMVTVPREETAVGRAVAAVLCHPFGVGGSRFRTQVAEPTEVDTAFNACFRRSAFDRFGLFDERLRRGQDMEFSLRLRRAGGRILLVPDARTRYYARSRPTEFLRDAWRNGVWAVLPFRFADGLPVSARHLVPGATLAAALVATVAAAAGAISFGWVAAPAALYLAGAVLAAAGAAWRERRAAHLLLAPPLFAGLHLAYGAGSLWGAARLALGGAGGAGDGERPVDAEKEAPEGWSPPALAAKRAVDLVVGGAALHLLSPLLALAAAFIWLDDRHSPVYAAPRVGKGGEPFRMVKLRTMVPDADRLGGDSTAADDPRITRVGAWVRAAKLDELLQLWNVLRGEMSLVGPRPQVPSEVEAYTAEERRLLRVRPGFTDFATVVFADEAEILEGAEDPDLRYHQVIRPWKSRMALHYLDRRSMWLDLRIVLAMNLQMISRRRALDWIASMLEETGADPSLVAIARRREPLPEAPPPGADRVVRTAPSR